MTITLSAQDILEMSQNQIECNSDLFTKGLNKEHAEQLLQSIESSVEQEVSNLVSEIIYDYLMVINDQN